MIFETYDHRNGQRGVPVAERLGLENLLETINAPVGKLVPKDITEPIRSGLRDLGWSGAVPVGLGTNITITSVHGDVGIAIQFGNVSRVYADLLKFQTLFLDGKISCAILLVPHRDLISRLSSSGGTDNRCTYERIVRELPVFSKVITLPLLVYGLFIEEVSDV